MSYIRTAYCLGGISSMTETACNIPTMNTLHRTVCVSFTLGWAMVNKSANPVDGTFCCRAQR